MKKCPYCGKKYFDDVLRCALDQTLLEDYTPEPDTASAPSERASPPPAASSLKPLGWILLLAGIGGTLYFAFGFSTTVPGSNVINLDLQQDRLLGFLDAQVNFLAGLLILLFGNLSAKLK